MTLIQQLLARPLSLLGFIPTSVIRETLHFARTVGKRLDEHREVVERLEDESDFLVRFPWHVGHLATQDDYLVRLYHLVHATWPDDATCASGGGQWRQRSGEVVRPRPKVLGPCRLPEYLEQQLQPSAGGDQARWFRTKKPRVKGPMTP